MHTAKAVLTIIILLCVFSSAHADSVLTGRQGTAKGLSPTVPGASAEPLAFSIYPNNNVTDLINALVVPGTGITVKSVTFTGAPTAAGLYYDGPFTMGNGIILASGDVTNALPPNTGTGVSTSFGLSGCQWCNAIIGPYYYSNDAAILEIVFDASDSCRSLTFEFVFGSEEYPEYVGTAYNDVFGAYLNGTQIAFDDKGNSITINGPFFSGGAVQLPPANGMEYDGSTQKLKTVASITPGSTNNTLVFVICDAGDWILDSGVLLRELKGSDTASGTHTGVAPEVVPFGGVECGDTLRVSPGDHVTFGIKALDTDPVHQDVVTLTMAGLPAGASMTPSLPLVGNPVCSQFSWIPGPHQVGTYNLQFYAKDKLDSLSDGCNVTIVVEGTSCQEERVLVVPWIQYQVYAHHIGPLEIDPTLCFPWIEEECVNFDRDVDAFNAPMWIGGFDGERPASSLNLSSLRINHTEGIVVPDSVFVEAVTAPYWPVVFEYFAEDSIVRLNYSIPALIQNYIDELAALDPPQLMWDTADYIVNVDGEYLDQTPFSTCGIVTIIGHRSGDVDNDGDTNVKDLTFLVAFLFRNGTAPNPYVMGDVDHDGNIDVVDLSQEVKKLFRGDTDH